MIGSSFVEIQRGQWEEPASIPLFFHLGVVPYRVSEPPCYHLLIFALVGATHGTDRREFGTEHAPAAFPRWQVSIVLCSMKKDKTILSVGSGTKKWCLAEPALLKLRSNAIFGLNQDTSLRRPLYALINPRASEILMQF